MFRLPDSFMLLVISKDWQLEEMLAKLWYGKFVICCWCCETGNGKIIDFLTDSFV